MDNLLSTVAKNILLKHRGKKANVAIQKEAAEADENGVLAKLVGTGVGTVGEKITKRKVPLAVLGGNGGSAYGSAHPDWMNMNKQANNQSFQGLAKEWEDNFGNPAEGYIDHARQEAHPVTSLSAFGGALLGAAGGAMLGGKAPQRFAEPATLGGGLLGGIAGGLGAGTLAGKFFPSKEKVYYRQPVYSDEQVQNQEAFYEQRKDDQVIDLLGQMSRRGVEYKGPSFEGLFGDGYEVDQNTLKLIREHPYLIDAVKNDFRRDRGGILHSFQDNLNAYRLEPERQQQIATALQRQLNTNQFGGWKGQWTPEQLDAYLNKQANDQTVSPNSEPSQAQLLQNFLSSYGLTPADFEGDPAANTFVKAKQADAASKIKGYFQSQSEMMGGMSDDMVKNQQMMLKNLDAQAQNAAIRRSISTTRDIATKDQPHFGAMLDLSRRSERALDGNKTDLLGAGTGALLGASAGIIGKNPIKRGLQGIAGSLLGGAAGFGIGRQVEEAQTGYDHGDILKPYELASRLQKRMNADQQYS